MTDAEMAWACIDQLFEEYKLNPVWWRAAAKLERVKREAGRSKRRPRKQQPSEDERN